MSELESRIAELESKREYAWRLYMYYTEKLVKLREPDEPMSKEECRRITSMIGKNVKNGSVAS